MAEFVGYRQERLLSEYEQMKSKHLCSDEEIRTIIKSREMYTYKITKPTRTLKDYCIFIAYERQILKKLTGREVNNTGKMSTVHYSIANNIKNLYIEGLRHFPNALRFWDEFFKFLKFSSFKGEISSSYEKMLAFHADKPAVWVKAALFEYHEVHNMERVKDLFMRALQRHPENEELHLTFFKVMLNETATMSTQLNSAGESEQSIGIDRVSLIYYSSKKRIHSIDYCIELLEITEEYPFATKIQREICEDMMNSFSRDEKMWHTLAQRELRGLHMSDLLGRRPDDEAALALKAKNPQKADTVKVDKANIENIPTFGNAKNTNTTEGNISAKARIRRIDLCYDVYSAAFNEFKSEKMWSYFLGAMLALNQDLSTESVLKRQKLGGAFKAAHKLNLMSEDHYCMFIDLLKESEGNPEDFVLNILHTATTRHPKSVKLWEQFMYHYISKNDDLKLEETFRLGCQAVGDDSHALFRLMLQYYQTNWQLNHKVDKFFEEACNKSSLQYSPFRGLYLEYVAVKSTLEEARQLYNKLSLLTPPNLELHKKMAYMESQALKPDIAKWRLCHENTTNYFGKTQTDVWISYLRFERDHGDPKNMIIVYERAKQALDSDLIDHFISEHSLFMTGIL